MTSNTTLWCIPDAVLAYNMLVMPGASLKLILGNVRAMKNTVIRVQGRQLA